MSIEQANIINELKQKLSSLAGVSVSRSEGSCQTVYSFKDYLNEKKIAENMSISEVQGILRVPKEFMKITDISSHLSYEKDTMPRIFGEVSASETSANPEMKAEEKPVPENQEMPAKKNGFDFKGLFKKITDGISEIKSPQALLSLENSTSPITNKRLSNDCWAEERTWEKEILGPLRRGTPIRSIQNKFSQLVKTGVRLPFYLRGEFWGLILQNRCRVTHRMFKALLTRVEMADPSVKESIKRDMDRTYSELRGSEGYLRLREDATLVLQLFEVGAG